MDKIVIVSRNKGIVSKEELLSLAVSLRDSLSVPVEFSTPQHLGTQVTFHDVIDIWINFENSKLFDITLTAIVGEIMKTEKMKKKNSLLFYFTQLRISSFFTPAIFE